MSCNVSVHVLPHIRKYLMVRLAPGARLSDPGNQKLLLALSGELRLHILHAQLDDVLLSVPRSRLVLVVEGPAAPELSHRRVMDFCRVAEATYRWHAHAWMDWYRDLFSVRIDATLMAWRHQYGITEDDLALETSRVAYVRHRKRTGGLLPRGGPRRIGSARIVI